MNMPAAGSLIDRHIAAVRRKLFLSLLLRYASCSLVVVGTLAILALLAARLVAFHLPVPGVLFLVSLALAALAAAVLAALRSPSPLDTALHIDRELGLHERFSTALQLRRSTGRRDGGSGFLAATLADAERTAASISTRGRFPLRLPRTAYLAAALALAFLTLWATLPQKDLLGRDAARLAQQQQAERVAQARQQIERALDLITHKTPMVAGDTNVERARLELVQLLERPIPDPAAAQRSALSALQDLEKAIAQRIQTSEKYAAAERDRRMLRNLKPNPEDKGPVAEAQRAIAQGDFDTAIQNLQKAVEDFQNLSTEEQKQQTDQMKALAQQLQQLGQNAQNQQQLAQQLQQAMQQQGVNPHQAQQMAQQMAQQLQQAASGNPQQQQQALQNLQQMAQQAMQQMNGGQGPSPQQQQTLQQALHQAMQQAQGHANAQQLAQAAQAIAQAMQQAQGGQPGQAQQPGNAQPMQDALEQMQQQLQAMQAMQNDSRAMDAAAQAARDAADQQAGQCNGNGDGHGNNHPWGRSHGDNARGEGQASGDRSFKETAPFSVKRERAPVQNDERGRILASTLVKAGALKGEANEQLKDVARSAEQQAAEEVDPERISRAAQRAVRQYFNSLGK